MGQVSLKGRVEGLRDDIHRIARVEQSFDNHRHVNPVGAAECNREAEDGHCAIGVIPSPGMTDPCLDHVRVSRLDYKEDAGVAVYRIVQTILYGVRSQYPAKVRQVYADNAGSLAALYGTDQVSGTKTGVIVPVCGRVPMIMLKKLTGC